MGAISRCRQLISLILTLEMRINGMNLNEKVGKSTEENQILKLEGEKRPL